MEEDVQHRGALEGDSPQGQASAGLDSAVASSGRKRPYSRSGQRRAYRIRFSETEFAMIRQAAGWTRMRPMGFAAAAAVAAAQDADAARAGILDARAAINELMHATAQFGRAGNNLNQIAKAYNSGADPTADIARVLAQLISAAARVEAAATRLAGG